MVWLEKPGAPIVYMQRKYRANIWRGAAFIAGFVAMAAGLPAIIGEAVLGAELAAAYPNVANAVGQVATRTVLTGGDIEAAVTGAASGLVGLEFGDVVGTAVDSAAIGAAAAAATTAALAGGDARQAAVNSLITRGGTIVSDLFPGDPSDYDPNDYLYLPSDDVQLPGGDDLGELSLEDLGLSLDLDEILGNLEFPEGLDIPADAVIPDDVGNLFAVDGSFIELSANEYIESLYPDADGNIRGPDNRVILPSDEVYKYLDDIPALNVAVQEKLELIGGMKLESWQPPELRPLNIPPAAAQTKVPTFSWAEQADKLLKSVVSIGASVKAISNGTFRPGYATSPYGIARPPVGVPVRQPDGSTVVNNGNGTQTVRYPDGRVQTMPSTYSSMGPAGNYGASLIPGVPNMALLIGGGLVVAALLLSRR